MQPDVAGRNPLRLMATSRPELLVAKTR